MSAARLLLHGAAAVLPVLALVLVAALQPGGAGSVRDMTLLGSLAVLSAQLAAILGWRELESCAQRPGWRRPALAGLMMMVLTHVIFGLLLAIALVVMGRWQPGSIDDFVGILFLLGVFSVGSSVVFVGWATAPAMIALSIWLHRLRGRELARAAA